MKLNYFFNIFFLNYYNQAVFVCMSLILSYIALHVSYFFGRIASQNINDKAIVYECGFTSFFDTRNPFFVNFFIIGILYLIFDLEIIIIYIYISVCQFLLNLGFIILIIFIIILVLAFYYECMNNALNFI